MRTLLVTNDFPPRQGGIQTFVEQLALRQPPNSLVVYASDHPGAAKYDAAFPFPVVRHRGGLLLPTPAVRRTAAGLLREHGCTAVWFGAAAPLGLLAPALRRAGAQRVVVMTHGHEAAWAMLPGARTALRRIGDGVDVVTYLGEYMRQRLAGPLGSHPRLVRLAPGVDVETFRPQSGREVRDLYGLGDRPVVVCVSRLKPRKGQDVLIEAMPMIRRRLPGVALLLVGDGDYRPRLERLAARHGVTSDVVFAGSVPAADLPAHYAAGDVFAMPCRTRRGGMDVEGLGIVFLEASATGLPVVVGDSGGAPDAVRDGETGYLVDGRDRAAVAAKITSLVTDPGLRTRMGAAGRAWVEANWTYDAAAKQLTTLLSGG